MQSSSCPNPWLRVDPHPIWREEGAGWMTDNLVEGVPKEGRREGRRDGKSEGERNEGRNTNVFFTVFKRLNHLDN